MVIKRRQLKVTGVVQGVGFRPFVYNLALQLELTGWVCNNPHGVEVQVEGSEQQLETFLQRLVQDKPPLSVIEELSQVDIPVENSQTFKIIQTKRQQQGFVLVSPDICTCADCVQDMYDPSNPRYGYEFINCTNCGPRFTIIKDLPYDREQTTMAPFPMCQLCGGEYHDPTNRRFHAQPNACPECGPQLSLVDQGGRLVAQNQVIHKTVELVRAGKILGLKGLGGYHLACDAGNQQAVQTLRQRKVREEKPFAIMVRDVETARQFCHIDSSEQLLLESRQRPIVLLKKRQEFSVAPDVAPENSHLGVMLPYTPLHFLLLDHLEALVMTSGNISSEPIVYKDAEAIKQLGGIADYFLVHNREIWRRVDDSVFRVFRNQPYPLRRSRGYAPEPIKLGGEVSPILAVGGEQKNTFAVSKGNYAFISHHIGDLENLETLESFETGIEDFKRMFNITPSLVAYDLHPEYLSTKYALELEGLPKIGIQHHEAHVASVMGEYDLQEQVIGVAFDGTGYGVDGKLWGGEFFVGDYSEFRRLAHLSYVPLPGGAKSIKEPWRIAASYLKDSIGLAETWKIISSQNPQLQIGEWDLMWQGVSQGINAPYTSSMGRLFDGVAALLGVRQKVSYEGQAAIELEQLAGEAAERLHLAPTAGELKFDFHKVGSVWEVDWRPVFRCLYTALADHVAPEILAWQFHHGVAEIVVKVINEISEITSLRTVCLSGGVFQNMILLESIVRKLEQSGYLVYYHRKVPTNDGGLALGQLLIANERGLNKCV